MMGASLLGRYPFGGELRHQFILFPFMVLSIFALVDEIVARLHHQQVAFAAVSTAVILNGVVQWRQVRFVDDEPAAPELATFDRYFGDSRAVYVDQTNLIYFFAAHQRDMWLAQSGPGPGFHALPVIERTADAAGIARHEALELRLGGPPTVRRSAPVDRADPGSIDRSISSQQGHAAAVHVLAA